MRKMKKMNKLEQLIKKLCPNGVEFKSLGDVCTLVTGATPSKTNPSYWENGTIPWMNSGEVNNKIVYDTENKITQLGYDKSSTTLVPVHSVVIALAGQGKTRGKVAITEIELCTNQSLCSIICSERINYKFLYYFLDEKYEELRAVSNGDGTRGGLSLRLLNPYLIPVPPIEVQTEIVKILDNFTELSAELTAELTARKKQYEYYRDLLLDFGVHGGGTSECEWRTLGEIATIVRGASPRPIKNFVTDDKNGVHWIKIGDVLPDSKYITATQERITPDGAAKSRFIHKGDFILSNSMSFGRPYILQIDGCIHDGWLSISDFEDYVSSDYLYHILTSGQIQQEMKKRASFGGAVQNLNSDIVKAIEIPIPKKSEQDRIVSILDRFDKLCNDISEGLPAEIKARRKQYEYYRDKMLSFNEA